MTPQTLPPAQALARLRDIEKHSRLEGCPEPETDHLEGDAILCALIRHMGHPEIADLHATLAQDWWYS